MKKVLTFVFLITSVITSNAQDEGYVMIDGLYYHYNDYAVSLVSLPDGQHYEGDIYVADYVTINGQQREVTSGWSSSIFNDCPDLLSVSLPPTFFIDRCIDNCPNLVSIYLRGKNKGTGDANRINGINIWKVKLYVDEENLEYYQSHSPFFLFHNIEVYSSSSAIRQAALSNRLGNARYYNIKGQEVTAKNKGVTIIVTESGSTYKVNQY